MLTEFLHETLGEIVIPSVLPRLSKTPGTIESLGPNLGDWDGRNLAQILEDETQIRCLNPSSRKADV